MANPEGAVDDLFGSDSEDDDEQQTRASQPDNTQPESLEDNLEDDVPDGSPQQGGGDPRGLFGSDEDEGDADQGPGQQTATQAQSSDSDDPDGRWRRRKEAPLGPPMNVDAPLLPLPATKSVHLLRTTNIVGVQPRAFDPSTYEREDESLEDEAGKARIKLGANAVIRWRTRRQPDGREVRESNARFVRWEDGSLQLLLGNEVLDVAEQDIRSNNQYLFVLRGLIQGQCPLGTKLALRPASLDSGLHKRLREVVDRKHLKVNKVVTAGGLQNPELEQQRREKAEDEKIRSRENLARKQDKVAVRAYGGGGYRSRAPRLRDQGEEEQDYDDHDDGLTADQRARLSLARNRTLIDENAEAEAGRRLQAAKRGSRGDDRVVGGRKRRMGGDSDNDEEEEEEEDVEYDDDEEEDEPEYESSGGEDDEGDDDGEGGGEPKAKKSKPTPAASVPEPKAAKPRRRGVVLSDDDSE